MAISSRSLNLVRDELFLVLQETERSLEDFVENAGKDASLLKAAGIKLNQARGVLKIVELLGAELLGAELSDSLQDCYNKAISQPGILASNEEFKVQIDTISNSVYALRLYLDNSSSDVAEIPEILIPTINSLRASSGKALMHESQFFHVNLNKPRPTQAAKQVDPTQRIALVKKCLQTYQIGVQNVLRDVETPKNLQLMLQSIAYLDALYSEAPIGKSFFIAAAAIESVHDSALILNSFRKDIFKSLLFELPKMLKDQNHEVPKLLLKDLLYLVALCNSRGKRAQIVRKVFAIGKLNYNAAFLEQEKQRMLKPVKSVMLSLSHVIEEEVVGIKDSLDLLERGTLNREGLTKLLLQVDGLSKTLIMANMEEAGEALKKQTAVVRKWVAGEEADTKDLLGFADTVLYIDSLMGSMKYGSIHNTYTESNDTDTLGDKVNVQSEKKLDPFAQIQLNEAKYIVVDESYKSISFVKKAIETYISNKDISSLNESFSYLTYVRGGLWFLGQTRAASLVDACARFISANMIQSHSQSSDKTINLLVDAVAGLEYFLESSNPLQIDDSSSILDFSANSLKSLGIQVT